MSCLPGGLGCVSERVGVRRHAVAACIALLLAGCSNAAPTVISVVCTDYGPKGAVANNEFYFAYETYYWSDSTKTAKLLKTVCP